MILRLQYVVFIAQAVMCCDLWQSVLMEVVILRSPSKAFESVSRRDEGWQLCCMLKLL